MIVLGRSPIMRHISTTSWTNENYVVILHLFYNIIHVPFCRPITMLDNTGIAEHHGMRRYVYIHKTIRSDQDIVADGHISHYRRVDPYPHPITNNWSPNAGASIRLTNHNAFVDITVTPYCRSTVDCYIISVPNI